VVTPFAIELLKETAKVGAEEAGKEGAKGLFSLFKQALRKRNMSTSEPEPLPPAESAEHRKDPKKPRAEKTSQVGEDEASPLTLDLHGAHGSVLRDSSAGS
jgi:hypothetical protein